MTVSEDREKALNAALSKIEKDFGKNAAFRMGDNLESQTVETIPSGSLAIDLALHTNGYPRGRIIEVYGPEASGKTLLTLTAIAEVQKNGGTAAFIDAEHAFDPSWAKKIGVNVKELIFAQPGNGEEALEITEALVRSKAVDIIVVDSVAALTPRKEIEGDMGDATMGVHARLMSQGLRKLTAPVSESKTTVFFINQLRSKIGVVFGNPEVTTGGNALKFYASVRLEVRRIEQLKDGTEIIGARTRAKVIKNKVAAPYGIAEYDMFFTKGNEGFSKLGDIRDLGEKFGILTKSGASYSYGDLKIGVGREKARVFLFENPEVAEEIEAKIRVAAAGEDPFADDDADAVEAKTLED